MRRRIASSIISGHDVCLFCAFRPVFDTGVRSRSHRAIREYSSSNPLSSPTGASAAQYQEEDDNEPPMLRQNQNLASSFPVNRRTSPTQQPEKSGRRTQTPQRPPDSDFTFSFPRQRSQPQPDRSQDVRTPLVGRRDRNARTAPDTASGFTNNFSAFSRRDHLDRPKRIQEDGAGRTSLRGVSINNKNGGASEGQERQGRHFNERGQLGKAVDTDERPASQSTLSGTRQFVPMVDTAANSAANVEPLNPFNKRVEQGQRPFGRSQEQSQRFRRATSDDPFKETGPREMQRLSENTRSRQSTRRMSDDKHLEDVSGDGEVSVADIVLPARTSTDVEDRSIGFHHRRGNREDKRKPRSSRYEDGEDGSTLESARSAPRQRDQRQRGARVTDLDYDMAAAEEALYGRKKKTKNQKVKQVEPSRPSVKISEFMTVSQLSQALGIHLEPFIEKLEEEGFEGARYDNILDSQTSSMFAELYGFEPIVATEPLGMDLVARPPPEDVMTLPPRPPIVTIMGHVDHGKTTILDYLRKSSVVATEHGGITQHIGAFSVTMPGTHRQITFLDTPGHAAFLEMRRRGANVTDIVVLVVAADDSVKPQTIEAIKHALEAKVQIIVAINKVDKEDANIERVKQDLTRHEIIVEDYGGDFQAIPVSGKTGQGMAELEEAIITLADVYDYRAETDGLAEGTIIESKVTAAGRVATILVRRGTLHTGDFIVAGTTWARVRTLRDDTGALVGEATPGTPVQVDGWRGDHPTAGLEVLQAENEDQAKDVVDFRIEQRDATRASVDMAAINEARNEEADARAKVLAWEAEQAWARKNFRQRPKDNEGWVEPSAAGGPKRVHFVVKADVAGSVEAVVAAVSAVGNHEIVTNIIHSGTGQLTESDIRMLSTTGETGYAISFNQPVDGTIFRLAEAAGLQILDQNIIYKVTDVVKDKLVEELPPLITQRVLGEAEIGQIFEVTIKKNKIKIAGCKVTNGTISRANKIRVQRNGSVVYTGILHSLKNVKRDVTEMRKGTECGMGFENWEDFQEGDQIQCFEEQEEKRTLY